MTHEDRLEAARKLLDDDVKQPISLDEGDAELGMKLVGTDRPGHGRSST
jgi:hypothetical protein